MIPIGWVLVPVIPSERMLDEFSEVAWPDKHELGPIWREKRALEVAAYAAMLLAAPTPPIEHAEEIESLRRSIRKYEKIIQDKNKGIQKLIGRLNSLSENKGGEV